MIKKILFSISFLLIFSPFVLYAFSFGDLFVVNVSNSINGNRVAQIPPPPPPPPAPDSGDTTTSDPIIYDTVPSHMPEEPSPIFSDVEESGPRFQDQPIDPNSPYPHTGALDQSGSTIQLGGSTSTGVDVGSDEYINALDSFYTDTSGREGIVSCDGVFGVRCNICHIFQTITNLIRFMWYSLALPAAIIAFLYGGIMWVTAGDNPAKVTKGKQALMAALIGLIIVFAAWLIVDAIMRTLAGGGIYDWGPWNEWPDC